ncbi:MAG: Diaminopimelate epimerase [Gemmatimonadetes bacterium]|nr:Diaminopimelate epimerase [Gemmatimonadota bacterium]
MIPAGRSFYKMSGSGNDFVVVDARHEPRGELGQTEVIQRICARGTGVGADGIVFLEPSSAAAIRLTYLNADGSRADLCGNATLCTTRLSVELGVGAPDGFDIETDSGIVAARIRAGQPEIDLQPVHGVQEEAHGIHRELGELRIGFALVGVPHLVILCDDVSTIDVVGRGRPLRHHPLMTHGANVNFVSPSLDGRWRMRTYERGVEAETLACGSGSVASAILLTAWGEASGTVELETSSGRVLSVRLNRDGDMWIPSLSGEGRVVYQAQLSEV